MKTDWLLIDAHTHTQPSEADTAAFLARLGMPPAPGDLTALLEQMRLGDVERTMIVPWFAAQDIVDEAVAAGADRDVAVQEIIARWRALNAWATATVRDHPGAISCVVGVDPLLMGGALVREEIALRLGEGAIGIKVAPMTVRAQPDDERLEIIWQQAREHDVFVLSECGSHEGYVPWGHPKHFGAVLDSYPDVRLQLAHLGVGGEDDLLALLPGHDNVFTDTALRLSDFMEPGWTPAGLAGLVRRIGVEKVLFGTNFPIVRQADYAEVLRTLPLTEDERHQIGRANALRLYRA